MLYCCGLRSSEARTLLKEDVDLNSGKVMIRESKGWKTRIVYMSNDLLEVCREYCIILDKMLPNREMFFPNKDGKWYSTSIIDSWFHEFWDGLPEAKAISGNPCRVHDFLNTHINKIHSRCAMGCLQMREYTSKLAPLMQEFESFKLASGRWSESSNMYLTLFDRYCGKNFPKSEVLSQEMLDGWCAQRHTENNNSCRSQIYPVVSFVRYCPIPHLMD